MNRVAFGLVVLSPVALAFSTPAPAATSCAPRAEIVAKLAQEFEGSQQAVGL